MGVTDIEFVILTRTASVKENGRSRMPGAFVWTSAVEPGWETPYSTKRLETALSEEGSEPLRCCLPLR
jgi:hypothetical protein